MREYQMMYNTKYDLNSKKINGAVIGKIIDTAEGKDIIEIIYDKKAYARFGFHASFQMLGDDAGKGVPAIVVDDSYQTEFYVRPRFFEAIAMHELGHYLHGDHQSDVTPEEAVKRRADAIRNGKVYEMEAKADCFAAKQVGKSAMIDALDHLIHRRKLRGDLGMWQAICEFELRKKLIKCMRY